jgi:large subunit ribosomal protein L9
MKVVLLKPRKNLGKIGDVVEVKDGFGRNFLIPQKIATRANEENLKAFEERKHQLEELNKKHLIEAQEAKAKIEGKDFAFISQCSDDGRLFGSVSAKDIAEKLSKLVSFVNHSNIVLDQPIKSLGIYEVNVHLHVDVDAKIVVNVARSETEAQDAIKAYKAENTKPEESAA